tara:strand:+ start:1446 stop:1778 length:333 start_codon:yes stop_codon:yes gene_type:complete
MDIKLLVISIILLLAISFLLLFLLKSFSRATFTADDGSIFDNKSDLDSYQALYARTKSLFLLEYQQNSNYPLLGFDKLFLTKLTREGFTDLKTLFKYRKQIKSLSDLINI